MHRILSFVGSMLFQFFFSVALVGGLIGTILCIREWPEAAKEDFNILPAVILLTVSLAVVGFIGIVRFRSPAERQLNAEADLQQLRAQKPVANVVWGIVALVAGIGLPLLQMRSAPRGQGTIISIPIVLICVGVLQAAFGLWQFTRREPPAAHDSDPE